MKICFISNGKSIHTIRWVKWFSQRGHEVQLITPDCEPIEGVTIHKVPINKGFFIPRLKILMSIKKIIKNLNPDILHAHQISGYGMYGALSGFQPFIVSPWGSDVSVFPDKSPLHRLIVKFVLKRAKLVFIGDSMAKKRLVKFGCPSDTVYVQAWGIDVDNFTPQARSDEFRRQQLAGKDGLIVTFVCSLEKAWEIPTLIEAAPLVLSEMGNVKFLIIGDGTERGHLEELIRKNEVTEQVKLLGRIESREMRTYLASSDLYVDTYYTDKAGGGIGVALMEAMCSGLPVVAGRRPGIEDGVKDGHNGYLFDGGKPEDMARKMLLLLGDENKRRAFGNRGRDIAIQIGDWKKNMADVEKLYHDTIDKQKSKRNK